MSESPLCKMDAFVRYLAEEGREKFEKAVNLNSNLDPESEPYKSKYEARELLQELKLQVEKYCNEDPNEENLNFACAALNLKIGTNYIETDETASGEESLAKCLEVVEPHIPNMRATAVFHSACNILGLLWSDRGQVPKALEYLKKAEQCYQQFKKSVGSAPFTVDEVFSPIVSETEDVVAQRRSESFEDIYTHTLYYLAQVHGKLDETKISAEYCLETLRRQLETKKYNPLDWSLNAAMLSQYYIGTEDFTLARHCLASASLIVQEAGELDSSLQPSDNESQADVEKREKIPRLRADIFRCWAKYGLVLLEVSRDKLMKSMTGEGDHGDEQAESVEGATHNADKQKDQEACQEPNNDEAKEERLDELEAVSNDPDKNSMLFDLELTSFEQQITDKLLLDFDQARLVFLTVQKWINSAKDFYVLDGHCSDHVELVQDHSRLFKDLAFFEPNFERQCKMHKRRLDMVSELVKQLSPQFYLLICRQLIYEQAETYSTLVDLKLAILEEGGQAPTPHAVQKINLLARKSIEQYQAYIDTLRNPDKELPSRLGTDDERPALVAFFCVGRLFSKFIELDIPKRLALMRKSLENYKFVVDYCKKNPPAVEIVKSEFEICTEMVQLMPLKMERIMQQSM